MVSTVRKSTKSIPYHHDDAVTVAVAVAVAVTAVTAGVAAAVATEGAVLS